jgi:hypothetical protein
MADRLTSDPEWNLYWTDLSAENFAVDPAGKLTYIDAENIVVADKQATKIGTVYLGRQNFFFFSSLFKILRLIES